MHTYSIDSDERRKITLILFVASILITMGLEELSGELFDILETITTNKNYAFLVEPIHFLQMLEVVPNIFGFAFIYGGISWIYNNYIWKLCVRFHKIPNLNGIWNGILESSYNNKKISMTLNIHQTWNEISFKSTFEKSASYSNIAAICLNDNEGTRIYFGFKNESNDVKKGMQTYYGYNILRLEDDKKIEAIYFNNRPNLAVKNSGGNMGKFTLEKQIK